MNVSIVGPDDRPELNVLGNRLWLRLTGADTGGRLTIAEQITPPGLGVPPHFHDREDETFHIVSGEVEFTVEGTTYLAHAGATIHLPRGVTHTLTAKGTEPARMLIVLAPSGIEHMFGELGKLPAGPPDMDKVTAICADAGVHFV